MKGTLTMVKHKYILSLFLLFGLSVGAQGISRTVVANAGTNLSSENMQLHFTLGEPIVGLITNENGVLDQGFWASYLFIELVENNFDDLVLFPIPVEEILHIVPGNNEVFGFRLFSMTGQQLMSQVFEDSGPEIQVDLSTLANATYIANVFVEGEDVPRQYKLIKR
ncbi:MAG: hypothetical protein AAF554_00705 [Bacteroidota bacterium]